MPVREPPHGAPQGESRCIDAAALIVWNRAALLSDFGHSTRRPPAPYFGGL